MITVASIIGGVWVFSILYLFRDWAVYRERMKIMNAIELYVKWNLYEEEIYTLLQIYNHMEPDNKTFWRLWDWGCKRILPREDYEKIKDFIV